MSSKERARLEVFGRVSRGEMTLVKACELLGLSYRQTKRSWSRYCSAGAAGLVHGLRGRASNRQGDGELKSRVLSVYCQKYADYGPTLAAECLASEEGLLVSVETLRGWLLSAGMWRRQRRRKEHRRRRPRKEHFGEMVQMDGSVHDWFEGRRGPAVLMVLIDDATSRVWARFFEQETLAGAWTAFRDWCERYGVPRSLYVDRHSIYRSEAEPTAEQLLSGEEPVTQFGRSLRELGVRLIRARSPQAKGRVERMNGTLQDRLVKAMRRAGVSDLAEANGFLEREFLPGFNERFAVAAGSSSDLHRAVESSWDLDRIFSEQEVRVVQHDWTVRWRNRFLQLRRATSGEVQPGTEVTVCEQLDGLVRVFAGSSELSWSPTRSEPQRGRRGGSKPGGELASHQGQRPAASHPWRRFRLPGSPPAPSSALSGSVSDSLRSSSTTPDKADED